MQCDTIARAIVGAAKEVGFSVPLVVRLEGTNVDEARRILEEAKIRDPLDGDRERPHRRRQESLCGRRRRGVGPAVPAASLDDHRAVKAGLTEAGECSFSSTSTARCSCSPRAPVAAPCSSRRASKCVGPALLLRRHRHRRAGSTRVDLGGRGAGRERHRGSARAARRCLPRSTYVEIFDRRDAVRTESRRAAACRGSTTSWRGSTTHERGDARSCSPATIRSRGRIGRSRRPGLDTRTASRSRRMGFSDGSPTDATCPPVAMQRYETATPADTIGAAARSIDHRRYAP